MYGIGLGEGIGSDWGALLSVWQRARRSRWQASLAALIAACNSVSLWLTGWAVPWSWLEELLVADLGKALLGIWMLKDGWMSDISPKT